MSYQFTGAAVNTTPGGYPTGQAKSSEAAMPGTLPGVIMRVESLLAKANSLRGHARDIRRCIAGTFPEPDEKPGSPRDVPNGFIDNVYELLDATEAALRAADDYLEVTWAKVG